MTNILMICLGNICRSPLAEGLMRSKLNFTKFKVDSAGTSGGHKGQAPDKRSIAIAKKNGLDITNQKSRKLLKEDFQKFDYIYVMDQSNYDDVTSLASTEEEKKKVIKILDEAFPDENLDVPDPYYGGTQGFESVYRMLDRATDVIAKRIDNTRE
ncbi:protein-tyrosine phosphatase [Nonlabens xylanidelens]|uniref:protein-tyrosine-phosphatase n=1 Tax=Nonlabens xylanidelens TaxID=191564 RepID=A0A2S6IL70_9FLAO|nr:low molecular weight protein-tyrosine-phosphatase [Nonlabens xylanidelens]PPK94982.1 protein-tyrosine phosphatase [Nonlabens xylanidelens]PQJ17525.1 protein-tyrosine-phosphatase [Nonlabens xylanidelens]